MTSEKARPAWRAAIAPGITLALGSYQTWLLNNGIFPVTSEAFPLAREFQTAVGVLVGLAVLLAGLRRPSLLKLRPMLAATALALVAGSAFLLAFPASPLAVTAGLCLLALGNAPLFYATGAAYAQVPDIRSTSVSVACALLVADVVPLATPSPGYAGSVLLTDAVVASCLALLWASVGPVFRQASAGQGAEVLALANPRSFLSPGHQVYILMFIYSAAFGFALSFRIAENTPLTTYLQVGVLAAVLAWFACSPRDRGHHDALFTIAALLVVAGFLLAPMSEEVFPAAANSLLNAGDCCFKVLSWTALAALCARNMSGAVVVLACGDIASSAGTFAGADLGHLCNALLAARPDAAVLVTGAAVLGLFAYVLMGLRGFSFQQTIEGIQPAEPLPEPAARPAPSRDELLERACDALAGERGLTDREREVLGMLARGHNGYHIRDELTLSYNTVKTHVKRVYRKLDVHSQQELIDLVDARATQP